VDQRIDRELARWSSIYAGDAYYYGQDPGPVARRAVRYHRAYRRDGGTALDAGCGEGQDLAFLAAEGYAATGWELTPEGAEKSRRLLESRGLAGTVQQRDLRSLPERVPFDLVLAVNSVQFMGADAPAALDRLISLVAPQGVIGLSLFGRRPEEASLAGTVWFFTSEELLQRFRSWQCLEAAKLWQWNVATNEPQSFITLLARNVPPAGQAVIRLEG
jgi:SAM-dependent methyltransferase